MKKYTVCAACVYETCFEVEAEDETAAEEIILERYNNNKEIVPKDEESYVFFTTLHSTPAQTQMKTQTEKHISYLLKNHTQVMSLPLF